MTGKVMKAKCWRKKEQNDPKCTDVLFVVELEGNAISLLCFDIFWLKEQALTINQIIMPFLPGINKQHKVMQN